jgi:8-oxo-dGTP pyrophosphatase MutT (NUDIX family)
MNDRLPELLARRLAEPLAGPAVGTRFEPSPRLGRRYDAFPPDARQAAVLLLVYPREGRWHVPLTLRHAGLADHAGQVSLPGGAVEPGESSGQAAVREFCEELGAAESDVELLGRLSPIYVHASNFRVEPWVGVARKRLRLVPNPEEVDELLEVPLAELIDPRNLASHQRHFQGRPYNAPHIQWQSHRIWGATCLILGQLVLLLEESGVGA